MGAFTWTHLRVNALSRDHIKEYCESAIKELTKIWYYSAYKENEDKAIEEWVAFNLDEDNKETLLECGKPESYFERDNLINELKKKISVIDEKVRCIQDVLDGKITLSEAIDKVQIANLLCISAKKYKDEYYVSMTTVYPEIFRLREYDSLSVNIHTVEDLIEYLRSSARQKFIADLSVDDCPYEGLTDKLANRIREFYGNTIGDNNFIVNFG